MTISIVVNGALGKMGRLAVETLRGQADFNLVATCGREDDLASILQRYAPQVVVDLTQASAARTNLAMIIEAGAHPVIGTSGLTAAILEPYQERCKAKGLGGIIVPNFSIGAVLMMRFAALAAPHFSSAEIIEAHHPDKRDAPSGTAIKTREGMQDPHRQSIPIHSIRMHGVMAEQQVLLGDPGELLTIDHRISDRSAYMPGLLLACRRVMGLHRLVYGLEHLLD